MSVNFYVVRKVAICSVIVFGLYGCSSKGIESVTGEPVTNVFETFKRGEARLSCDTSCSGAWGKERREAKQLYDQGSWLLLVNKVARVGYSADQTYFYLGSAAESLGYHQAARQYYNLAMVSFKCNGLFNNCDGLVLPQEAVDGLSRLPGQKETENSSGGGVLSGYGNTVSPGAVEVEGEKADLPLGSKLGSNALGGKVLSGESQSDLDTWFEGAEARDGYSLVNLAIHYQRISYELSGDISRFREVAFAFYILAKNNLPYEESAWKEPSLLLFKSMTPNEVVKAKGLAYIVGQRGVKNTVLEYLSEG